MKSRDTPGKRAASSVIQHRTEFHFPHPLFPDLTCNKRQHELAIDQSLGGAPRIHTLLAERKCVTGRVGIQRRLIPATDLTSTTMDQTNEMTSVGSHGEASLPGQTTSSRAMQVSNSVNASSAGSVARRFHPSRPDFLHVGNRRSDGTEVWLSASHPAPRYFLIFYNEGLGLVPEKVLGIDWLDHFKDTNFPGSTERKRKEARRLFLIDIIGTHRHDRVSTTDSSSLLRDTCLLTTNRRGKAWWIQRSESPTFPSGPY